MLSKLFLIYCQKLFSKMLGTTIGVGCAIIFFFLYSSNSFCHSKSLTSISNRGRRQNVSHNNFGIKTVWRVYFNWMNNKSCVLFIYLLQSWGITKIHWTFSIVKTPHKDTLSWFLLTSCLIHTFDVSSVYERIFLSLPTSAMHFHNLNDQECYSLKISQPLTDKWLMDC